VLHQPSGNIFAACSTPESRVAWTPALERLNASARSTGDFIAIFDPATDMLRRFTLSGFTDPRGLNVHGMDVIQSSLNPAEFWVYAVNQRPPLDGMTSERVAGPKSSIEIFRLAALTANTLEHVATVDASPIISPNDVVGSADGTHFWFTNDGSHARGLAVSATPASACPARSPPARAGSGTGVPQVARG
jgi:arylesterase/paraoxonase